MKRNIFISIIIYLASTFIMCAQNDVTFDAGIIQNINNTIPDSIFLTNEKGNRFNLSEKIDKITIISFVYYNCKSIGPSLLDEIKDVVKKNKLIIGKDYQIFTVSIDVSETAELAREKKELQLKGMDNKDIVSLGWSFCVSDSNSLKKLTQACGFRFTQNNSNFIYPPSLIFINPKGKITRYINGAYILTFEFKMALIESSLKPPKRFGYSLLKFFYTYDIQANRYVLDVTKITLCIVLSMFIAIVLIYLSRLLFKKIKTKQEAR